MRTLRAWLIRTCGLFRRGRRDRDFAAEIEAHLQLDIDEGVRSGLAPEQARRRAILKLGGIEQVKEMYREQAGIPFLDHLFQDLRYAVRILRKNRAFTLTAILTLALGVGANTAVFSVVQAVLLRPLPYPEPDRLVRVARVAAHGDVSMPEFEFCREHGSVFAAIAAHRGADDRRLVTGAGFEWVKAMPVSGGFLRTLGIAPALGREFGPPETRPGGTPAILLSDGLWRRAFGSDPEVLGRLVRLGQVSYTVAGVLPRGFWFPQPADAFVSLSPNGGASDEGTNTQVIARLKPGVGLGEARAAMLSLSENFRRFGATRLPRDRRDLTLVPYHDWLAGEVRPKLLLLFGAVGLLLLVACSNLASLLLARLAARQQEIAVRLALGCSRGRLLQQLLAENLLLGIAGGLAGFAAGHWLLDGFLALVPFQLPACAPVRLDFPVLLFTLAVAVGTGLAFSLAQLPASSGIELHSTLKAAGRSAIGGVRQRLRGALVVSQVALSVTMLIAAALLIQSLYRLNQEQLGFAPRGLVTFWTPPATERQGDGEALRRFEAALLERLERVPGVRSVAAVNVLPLTDQNNFPAQREGRPEQSIGGVEIRLVTPAYFETMGIAIRRGRSFNGADTAAAPPVIIVNETLARRWWPAAHPLGDRIVIGRFRDLDFGSLPPREVVGVAADTKSVYLKEPPRPTVYVPAAQSSWMTGGMAWVVRARLSPGLAGELRQAVAEVAPGQRVERMRTMSDIVEATTAGARFDAWLYGAFAGLALLLTATGVYGLLAFSVARRTREIGARMALGASPADVLRMVLRQGLGLIGFGLAAGLAGALLLTRFLSHLLYQVRPTDRLSYLAAGALLLAVGLLASYLPARRATRVDPTVALRYE